MINSEVEEARGTLKMNKIEVFSTRTKLIITINGLRHLVINHGVDELNFQSWIDDTKDVKYHIEYYLENRTILTEYENREDWEEILKRI